MSVEFPLTHKGQFRVSLPPGRPIALSPSLRRIVFGRTVLGRVGRAAAAIVVGGITAILAVQAVVYASAEPKGLMYDVGGGRRMRLVCDGPAEPGRPTVIYESGAFGFSGDWANV